MNSTLPTTPHYVRGPSGNRRATATGSSKGATPTGFGDCGRQMGNRLPGSPPLMSASAVSLRRFPVTLVPCRNAVGSDSFRRGP